MQKPPWGATQRWALTSPTGTSPVLGTGDMVWPPCIEITGLVLVWFLWCVCSGRRSGKVPAKAGSRSRRGSRGQGPPQLSRTSPGILSPVTLQGSGPLGRPGSVKVLHCQCGQTRRERAGGWGRGTECRGTDAETITMPGP